MPAQLLVDAKQTALTHYGRLVLLAEDAAAGPRARFNANVVGRMLDRTVANGGRGAFARSASG